MVQLCFCLQACLQALLVCYIKLVHLYSVHLFLVISVFWFLCLGYWRQPTWNCKNLIRHCLLGSLEGQIWPWIRHEIVECGQPKGLNLHYFHILIHKNFWEAEARSNWDNISIKMYKNVQITRTFAELNCKVRLKKCCTRDQLGVSFLKQTFRAPQVMCTTEKMCSFYFQPHQE